MARALAPAGGVLVGALAIAAAVSLGPAEVALIGLSALPLLLPSSAAAVAGSKPEALAMLGGARPLLEPLRKLGKTLARPSPVATAVLEGLDVGIVAYATYRALRDRESESAPAGQHAVVIDSTGTELATLPSSTGDSQPTTTALALPLAEGGASAERGAPTLGDFVRSPAAAGAMAGAVAVAVTSLWGKLQSAAGAGVAYLGYRVKRRQA
jgi:hypothetical protein